MKLKTKFSISSLLVLALVFSFSMVIPQGSVKIANAYSIATSISGVTATLSSDQNTLTFYAYGNKGCAEPCNRSDQFDVGVNADILGPDSATSIWSGYQYFPPATGSSLWSIPAQINPPSTPNPMGPVNVSGFTDGHYSFCVSVQGSVTYRWPIDYYSSSYQCAQFTIQRTNAVIVTQVSKSNLAVYGNPQVSLFVNGQTVLQVASGTNPIFNYVTTFANAGNSCVASSSGGGPNWSGSKSSTGGYFSMGAFNTPGTYVYSIYCHGFLSDSPISSVEIIVGNVPSYSCVITSGQNVSVNAGNNTSAVMQVTPYNGFAENVTFSGTFVPSGANSPTIPNYSNNPEVSPYGSPTNATIHTTSSTATGQYQTQFTGQSASGIVIPCPNINLTVNPEAPSVTIFCDGQTSSCATPLGGNNTITWESHAMTSCTVAKSGTSGNWDTRLNTNPADPTDKNSGALSTTTIFTLNCTGASGPLTSQVIVNVDPNPLGPPTNVTATQGTVCGTAVIAWAPPTVGLTPNHYDIYRSTTGTFTNPSLSTTANTITDLAPLNTNGNNYYAVKSVLGNNSSVFAYAVPANLVLHPCAPDLANSDKDLYQVDANTHSPATCNGASDTFNLPGGSIFKTGSRVYFNITVCNSGYQTLTGIKVVEQPSSTLSNLTLETPYHDSTNGSCLLSGSGTAGDPYIVNNLVIDANNPSPPPALCNIKVSGILTQPSSSTGFLYRFWNQATISSNELPNKKVSTIKYLFSNNGKPTRNEGNP